MLLVFLPLLEIIILQVPVPLRQITKLQQTITRRDYSFTVLLY